MYFLHMCVCVCVCIFHFLMLSLGPVFLSLLRVYHHHGLEILEEFILMETKLL